MKTYNERKKMMRKITIKWLFIILLLLSQWACANVKTFRGKIIDADTLKPIEGAAVVAVWRKTKAFIIASTTDFKDAKETLTDKNGEWSITGEEGQEVPKTLEPLFVLGLRHITTGPEIIYYKPGYRGNIRGGFSAYPYIDRKHNLEGIVLNRYGETWEEIRKDSKQFPRDSLRFIPVKDPEKKLRELAFSFQYPENLQIIQRRTEYSKVDYEVIGLRKAKTRKERRIAIPSRPTDDFKKIPLLNKILQEEVNLLYGGRKQK